METVAANSSVFYNMKIGTPQRNETAAVNKMVSLYIGDLHPDVTDDDLVWAFNEFVSLVSVKVCRDYWSKESIGYGFVNFKDPQDAAEAIRTKNHMLLRGKAVRLMWSNRAAVYRKSSTGNVFVKNLDKSVDSSRLQDMLLRGKAVRLMWSNRAAVYRKSSTGNVFVKNLDKSVDSSRLQDMFHEFGNIISSKVAMSENGSSKGYGFVQFETQVAADAAIKALNGKNIDGKNIYVATFVPKSARSVPNPDAPYTNLYVKNLELDITGQQFQEIFSKFGEISSVAISTDEHGSSKGFGFVSFENPDDARHAAEAMNGSQLGSKVLYVGRAQTKSEREQMLCRLFEEKRKEQMQKYKDCNVYVKNIDDSVNEDMLRELFSQCGAVSSVKLMRHPKGMSRGFGFVCFSNPEEAKIAIHTFHSYMFHGKPLYAAIAQRKEERQAQLQKHYNHLLAGNVGPSLPPVMSVGYTPVYYPTPPAIVAPFPPQPGIIYPPLMNFRPGWRANGYVPPPRPTFHTHQQPMRNGLGRHHSNGVYHGAGLQKPVPNPVDLSSFVAAADPSQQKNILGQRLLPLVRQLQPDVANKITGMLLELDISELLWLLDSPTSLEEKVNEAFNVLKVAKAKEQETRERAGVAVI